MTQRAVNRRGLRFEALLDDTTGQIALWWTGRKHVPGVEVGAGLTVEGTAAGHCGSLVLWNPLYEFISC